jgi:hypothetical protein
LLSACAFGQVTDVSGDLLTESLKFIQLQDDLIQLSQSALNNNNDFESRLGADLLVITQQVMLYLDDMALALDLYKMVGNDNRARAEALLKNRGNYHLARIDLNIKQINLDLSGIKGAGLAATGVQLRDEVRRVQDLLGRLLR